MGQPTPLSFADGQASGVEELTGAPPMSINMLIDAGKALYTRPGLAAWADWPCPALAATEAGAGPIIGGAIWNNYLVYVTTDRRIWVMLGPNNRIALSDATAATKLDGSSRPTFAVGKSMIVIAGGGAPQKWTGIGLSARLGGSPPIASHVVANHQRLVLSAPTPGGFIFWSQPGETGWETWDTGIEFAEAEAKPDVIVALQENANELYTFGAETLQLFFPDPSDIYITGRAQAWGLKAPYSAISLGDAGFVCLADDKGPTFASTDGRQMQSISGETIDSTIFLFKRHDDCWGFRVQINSWDLYVWTFPTEGRTLVFDPSSKQWSEWRSRGANGWTPWPGQCFVRWPSRELALVGMPDGTMATMDIGTFQDYGVGLVGLVRTGFQDRGAKVTKTCERLTLTMRRGVAGSDPDAEPFVSVRWRNGLGAFCQPLRYGLGLNGDTTVTKSKWALGQYVDRQYEMEFSANTRLVLTAAEELITTGSV